MQVVARRAHVTFRPGQAVLHAGVYRVLHRGDHRRPEDIVLLADGSFMPCVMCGRDVRFELLHSAPYIFEDEDFSGRAL